MYGNVFCPLLEFLQNRKISRCFRDILPSCFCSFCLFSFFLFRCLCRSKGWPDNSRSFGKIFFIRIQRSRLFTVPWLRKKLTQNPQFLVFFNISHDYSPCKSGISLMSCIFFVSVNTSQSTLFPLHSAHCISVSSCHVVFNLTAIQYGYANAQLFNIFQ